MGRRVLIITPCRDEMHNVPATIDSLAAQTLHPSCWVVVDDGSTDETPQILEAARSQCPFLRIVRRQDRGSRSVGPGVVNAFEAGLASMSLDDFDYVCKLDADLELPARYFERLVELCEAEPRIGTISGKLFVHRAGRLAREWYGDDNSVGPAKFYRVQCFRDIGGFAPNVGWDGIDGHLCRTKGWLALSRDEPDLRIVHRRRMGSSQGHFWNGRLRWGAAKWWMGSGWVYVLVSSLCRMFEHPYLVGGVGILFGYLRAMIQRDERFPNAAVRRSFRRYEYRILLLGRRRAMESAHRRILAES